jgi:GAF domain-containing protein
VAADIVLDAIVRAAVEATGATRGWLVATDGAILRVVAAAGGERPGDLVGAEIAAGVGTAGLVIAGGQPMAVALRESDEQFAQGVIAVAGASPKSILSVPCGDDEIVGALELIDKRGARNFAFDDVEIATMLADIAAAAIVVAIGGVAPPSPAQLAAELDRIAADEPARYGVVAKLISALLDQA